MLSIIPLVKGKSVVTGNLFQVYNWTNLTPQTMLDVCILHLFRVSSSTLYRVGGGRTARKFRKWCTVLRGNRQMTEKYEYRSTVPRTFVQDCSLIWWIFHLVYGFHTEQAMPWIWHLWNNPPTPFSEDQPCY